MDEIKGNLDVEFKRYLQILRPYVGQLVEKEAIQICNEWIQRLNSCCDEEKPVRNKYIFVLCYQLAKGILTEPFIKAPPTGLLPNISEVTDSDTSSVLEYDVTDEDENYTKVLYENHRHLNEQENHSNNKSYDKESISSEESSKDVHCMDVVKFTDEQTSHENKNHNMSCYYPEEVKTCTSFRETEMLESRANNLIFRLREFKKQNTLLKTELAALKEGCKDVKKSSISAKSDNATCTYARESSTNLNTLKSQIRALSKEKQDLSNTLETLQTQLDEFEDNKKRELEELVAKHKMEVTKLKLTLRDENKYIYEVKIDELKEHYENIIAAMEKNEIQNAKKIRNEIVMDIDKLKQENSKEMQEKDNQINAKVKELLEKDNIIHDKNLEIAHLESQLEEQKIKLQSMINKFLTTPLEKLHSENVKERTEELEKRLNKVEKSKTKCLKAYEAKLTALQREKHLAVCSLQLQLVKQRAHIVNELAEENQADLTAALDKLEAKYKDIVANVQSTAIQRTLQDEMAINAILEAACACGLRNEMLRNLNHPFGAKTFTRSKKERSPDRSSEILGAVFPKGRLNPSFAEENEEGGFCLDGDRLGELFEKVYIPMRDIDSMKKENTPY